MSYISSGGGGGGSTPATAAALGWTDVYTFATATDQASIDARTGNDVTYAVTAAIVALPTAGGVLYFRPGRFVTSGGFTIDVPVKILGAGPNHAGGILTDTTSQVECNANAATLFTITAMGGSVECLALVCTAAVPALGSRAVWVDAPGSSFGGTKLSTIDFHNLYILGFFDAILINDAEGWVHDNVTYFDQVRNQLMVVPVTFPDAGDWVVCNSWFWNNLVTPARGVYCENLGNGRISNCKFGTPFSVAAINCVGAAGGGGEFLNVHDCHFDGTVFGIICDKTDLIQINNCLFTLGGSTNPCVNLSNAIDVSISNNQFLGSGTYAVTLTTVTDVLLSDNINDGYTNLVSVTTSTNVTKTARPQLVNDITYYVRSADGDDTNTGFANTAAGAFKTVQKGVDTVAGLDVNGNDVTIQLVGNFTENIVLKDYVGTTKTLDANWGLPTGVKILGDRTTPSNVQIGFADDFHDNLAGNAVSNPWIIDGVQFVGSSANGFNHLSGPQDGPVSIFIGNVDFATSGANSGATSHIQGLVSPTGDYTISAATFRCHLLCFIGMRMRNSLNFVGFTVTLTAGPAVIVGSFARSEGNSTVEAFGATYVGAATGIRYAVLSEGVIETYGSGATYFPGNVAGTNDGTGVYD